ncbi:SDR family NAD(P)-dependent oxidoreductase [Paeniglutamicibacter gangotriensis]|uniref:Dehydrogenase n=2 Tax=Paeniglutamicibacter gangotriensis TaxID=254787 RepID=M7NCG4_9MICC|nr:SDR family NAD(P)-dependent oxidoreductase [Paeniglutamicibacter gangotriensis]EMQ99509.1 dehydrogenase [Paeniglutamicibacter gangotriensis Lz1y]KAA0978860.1 SDR family oxidoreductase [Paeniglutamicibacter gangotriensis]
MQLENKVVIVTGGAAGIGGAISRVLVARGAKIVAVDLNAEAGDALVSGLGENVRFLAGDVSDKAVAEAAVKLAKQDFGGLDGLVNNAHASRQAMFNELTEEQWDLSFNTGFRATRQFMAAAYPLLATNGGSVVNFGSGSAMVGQMTQAAYASAKEAIRGLSRVTANEWAKDNIRVNVVSPMALTDGVKAWSEAYPQMYQDSLDKIPLGRFGDPETDVAPIVAFLLSDDSRYMTGQTVMADGGANKLY